MESKITSDAINIPANCRSTMEHMEAALKEEDNNFLVAQISESCCAEIRQLEEKLSQELKQEISLVAYSAQ